MGAQTSSRRRTTAGCGEGMREPIGPVPNATQPPLFLARFSPKFRPFSAIFRPFSPSWRQEAGNRERTVKRRHETGETWPRNGGLYLWVEIIFFHVRSVKFMQTGVLQFEGKPGERKNPCSSAAWK